MKMEDVIGEVKLELTGNVLELEIDDASLKMVVEKALRELQRYWDETTLITIPYASCIVLDNTPLADVSSIVKVYRTVGIGDVDSRDQQLIDPAYMQMWTIFSNGNIQYSLSDFVMNYASWNTLSQIRNTMSTDLSFKFDRHNSKLYVNGYSMSRGDMITVEYIPKLQKVEDIKSDYWQDILVRYSVDMAKILLGRIRTRFTANSSVWSQDGDKLLSEGEEDLKELRDKLNTSNNVIYPID